MLAQSDRVIDLPQNRLARIAMDDTFARGGLPLNADAHMDDDHGVPRDVSTTEPFLRILLRALAAWST